MAVQLPQLLCIPLLRLECAPPVTLFGMLMYRHEHRYECGRCNPE